MALEESFLIESAQNGNTAAFEELVYRYDKNVLSIASKYFNNTDDAKDVYQEVFIRVFKSLKNFRFKSEFSTWLFRITTNVCLTHKKRERKRSYVSIHSENDEDSSLDHLIEDENIDTPDKIFAGSEISGKINSAMENLTPRQKMIFVLKHYEGYKIKEISEMTGLGEGTVKKYLFEAVHNLRDQLKEFYE